MFRVIGHCLTLERDLYDVLIVKVLEDLRIVVKFSLSVNKYIKSDVE